MDAPTPEVISELADLVKLELSDSEKSSLVAHFTKLISFIDQIKVVPLINEAEIQADEDHSLRADDGGIRVQLPEPPTYQVPRIIP